MKITYKNYVIYSDASSNNNGIFDVRVVLQKLGTTKITSHYPSCSSLTKNDSETQGTISGKKIIDKLLQKPKFTFVND